MGRNKSLRKRIEGEERVIREHQEKIDLELSLAFPNQHLIKKWQKDIERHERIRAKLISKLPGKE